MSITKSPRPKYQGQNALAKCHPFVATETKSPQFRSHWPILVFNYLLPVVLIFNAKGNGQRSKGCSVVWGS